MYLSARVMFPELRKLTRMTSYAGLILDFGGVVTTDFYGALAAFEVRSGLDAGAFVRVLREDPGGRAAFHAAECGQVPQRDFEVVMGRLLGLPDNGLLAAALADLETRPAIIDLVRPVRGRHQRQPARRA
jgi:hypothetical protein